MSPCKLQKSLEMGNFGTNSAAQGGLQGRNTFIRLFCVFSCLPPSFKGMCHFHFFGTNQFLFLSHKWMFFSCHHSLQLYDVHHVAS